MNITKIGAVVAGLFSLMMSMLIYPYVNEYLIKVGYQVTQILAPGMNDTDHFIWKAMPFVVLFLIFYLCTLIILGRVKALGGKGDDDRDDGGDNE